MKKRIESHWPQAMWPSQKWLVRGLAEPADIQSLMLSGQAAQQGDASTRATCCPSLPSSGQAGQKQQALSIDTWAHQKSNNDGACL